MSELSFRLHEEGGTYGLAPSTHGRLLPVALARIMGPTDDEAARELAQTHGLTLEIDGDTRTVTKDGETTELPRFQSWRGVWAQIAPHILEGVDHDDVDPARLCVPEVARAYLYWSVWEDNEQITEALAIGMIQQIGRDELRELVPEQHEQAFSHDTAR